MGEALQIRVSAVTWNEELLEKLWPRLTDLAFSVPIKHERRGVLEMVRALHEGLAFMDWSEKRKATMGPLIRKAQALKTDLEQALSNWQASKANTLSVELEAVLDELERAFTV
ncbi:MAG: hypothetical protein J5803_02725 [Desulfovibrio sp.]|nr:hypothetical protein [Desulfovibrio sp.]